MSKIICELCGTAYPDTADCCPTCGTEKPEAAEFTPPVQEEPAPKREYTPTKGGRFSDANVRKRLKNKGIPPAKPKAVQAQEPKKREDRPGQERPRPQKQQSQSSGSNKGLVIAAVIYGMIRDKKKGKHCGGCSGCSSCSSCASCASCSACGGKCPQN